MPAFTSIALGVAAAASAASAGYGMASGSDGPAARNIGQESRDTLQAQIDLAPDIWAKEKEYRPKYADLDRDTLIRTLLGSEGQRGLMSYLEQDIGPAASRMSAASQTAQRGSDIADVEAFGPRGTAAIAAMDPKRAALLDTLTSQASDELGLGASLDPSLRREVEQAVRSGQADRGFGYGPTDVFTEAMTLGSAGQALRDKRRAFAQNIINQRSSVYGDPFLQVLGRPSTANPQSYVSQAGGVMAGSNPQQFDPWSDYAGDLWNTNYNASQANYIAGQNRNSALTSSLIGGLGQVGAAYYGG